MTRDIYIVAGSKAQFQSMLEHGKEAWNWEISHKLVHEVTHPDVLKDVPAARVVVCGTFLKRKDWAAIEQQIIRGKHRALPIRGA